jgi:hypothetical protein
MQTLEISFQSTLSEALQVGDEVIVNNDGFDIKPIISIGEAKVIDNDLDVVHPCTEKGYHFVNNILVEG